MQWNFSTKAPFAMSGVPLKLPTISNLQLSNLNTSVTKKLIRAPPFMSFIQVIDRPTIRPLSFVLRISVCKVGNQIKSKPHLARLLDQTHPSPPPNDLRAHVANSSASSTAASRAFVAHTEHPVVATLLYLMSSLERHSVEQIEEVVAPASRLNVQHVDIATIIEGGIILSARISRTSSWEFN